MITVPRFTAFVGFSWPFQLFAALSGLVYATAGVALLWRVMERWFGSRTIPLMERADRQGTPPLPDPELLSRNDSFGAAILKMAAAMPQQQQVHYALALSYAKNGWTPGLRSRYFSWFESAGRTRGGQRFGARAAGRKRPVCRHDDGFRAV